MIERGSDKVGPRIDEELERRVQPLERGEPSPSRAEEFREEEAAGDDEPGTDVHRTADEAERRSELARHLQPTIFPADRERLLSSARELNAPPAVIELLERTPDGREFADVEVLWDAIGRA